MGSSSPVVFASVDLCLQHGAEVLGSGLNLARPVHPGCSCPGLAPLATESLDMLACGKTKIALLEESGNYHKSLV